MTTPGPIALLGGGEHLPPCEAGDRRLLDLTGASAPAVAVIPAASSHRQFARTSALARDHWQRLGTSVQIVDLGMPCSEAADLIAAADLIVLPGGHPDRLMRRLASSALRGLIFDRWSRGAGVAGSSAGAMCLFRHRLRLYPPNPLGLRPGLGILTGFVVAPHFDRFRARRWAHRACLFLPGRQVLGIDENTSLVGHLDALRVHGTGGVVITSYRRSTEFRASDHLPDDTPLARPRQRSVPKGMTNPPTWTTKLR